MISAEASKSLTFLRK